MKVDLRGVKGIKTQLISFYVSMGVYLFLVAVILTGRDVCKRYVLAINPQGIVRKYMGGWCI